MIDVQIIDNADLINPAFLDVETNYSHYTDEVFALNSAGQQLPPIILINYSVRKEGTPDYIKLLLGLSPNSKVIVIADELSDEKIMNCLVAGARGYQNAKQLDSYVNLLVHVVSSGEIWITRRLLIIVLETLFQKHEKKQVLPLY